MVGTKHCNLMVNNKMPQVKKVFKSAKNYDSPHLQNIKIPTCEESGCKELANKALVAEGRAQALYCMSHAENALKNWKSSQ